MLRHQVAKGKFLRIHLGVCRLAQFPDMRYADLFAAWLAAGEKAVVSHDSALALYGLSDQLPSETDLTVPRTASRRLAGVGLHTSRLASEEITRRHGPPVSTLSQTLADLILAGLGEELIPQKTHEALDRGMVTAQALATYALQRCGRAPGGAMEEPAAV